MQETGLGARAHAKRVIEALLFASKEPLPMGKIREIVETSHPFKTKELTSIISELQSEYQERSFCVEEIAQGFVLRTRGEFTPYLEKLCGQKRPEKLSRASTEVLAIIAYRQPITRAQVEAIRGVDCSNIIQSLLERVLIEAVGKLEVPGRPTLYSTTRDFLQHFGLRDVKDLPPLAE